MTDDNFKAAETAVEPTDPEAALIERVKAEQEKYPKLPPKYVGFTIKFKGFWMWMNIFNILMSSGMIYGSVAILNRPHD